MRDWSAVHATFNTLRPDIVVHAAAITEHINFDARELIETNVLGTRCVARIARALGVRLVYLSTHYVYAGKHGGYREYDEARPVGAYAMSKYVGEEVVRDAVPDALIVRGSWYTPAKLALWREHGAFSDAWSSREPVAEAARKIGALALGGATGVYNIGGPRRTFTEICAAEGVAAPRTLRASWRGPYAFPQDSSVDTAKWAAWSAP